MAETERLLHECVLCDRVLESKEALQEHFRKHANKEIEHTSSSKSRLPRKILKKEISGVKKEKSHIIACDVCGQEFTNNTLAIQHKFKKHPDVSVKYLCPYCGMQFTIRALFDNHLKTHTADTREKCSILCDECGAEFYFEEAKDYHNKSTHKRVQKLLQPVPTPPPSKKIKMNIAGEIQSVYYCHLCGSEYVIKFNLQKHLEKAHTEEERCIVPNDLIRCTTCDALFYNQKAYETHNVSHKSDDLYVTSEQQRLQTVSRVDQDFDIRRVLPVANKYLPSYKNKPRRTQESNPKVKGKLSDDELSPPSSPDSTDSDPGNDALLVQTMENTAPERPILESIGRKSCKVAGKKKSSDQ